MVTPPHAGLWLCSRFLAEQGVEAIGSDYDQKTLDYLAQRFPNSPLTLAREGGSAMSLPDRSVDLSVHNGFWVCFSDDAARARVAA